MRKGIPVIFFSKFVLIIDHFSNFKNKQYFSCFSSNIGCLRGFLTGH